MQDLKQLVNDINQSFLEFKTRNDQRLRELEQGRRDPLLNQQVDGLAREVQDLAEIKSRMEHIETQINRPMFETGTRSESIHNGERSDYGQKQTINKYLRYGESALTPDEVKQLSVDSDPQGGYWVTGDIFKPMVEDTSEWIES